MRVTQFSESDFEKLEIKKCSQSSIHDLLALMNSETLGKKVSTAIRLKQQGHFNQAMLFITEANRDQVIAIRKIQKILDKAKNQNETEIILENYRQSFPLQMGLSNGKDVLGLLDNIGNSFNGALPVKRCELHQAENDLDQSNGELIFFQERMQGRISSEELDLLREKVNRLTKNVYLIKKGIADNIIEIVGKNFTMLAMDDKLSLIGSLFQVITSSIETMDAKFVAV
jgi:hypothetical protein